MNDAEQYDDLPYDQLRDVDAASWAFEQALRSGTPVTIESQLAALPAPAPDQVRSAVFRELLAIELEWCFTRDQHPDISEYQARFPTHDTDIRQVFLETRNVGRMLAANSAEATAANPRESETTSDDRSVSHLQRIGRYRIDEFVGRGAFGLVYRAHDEQLGRDVAVKVPHGKTVSKREYAATYLTEAQNVAAIDHPYVLPVYDFGSNEEIPCYIVSKYVDGSSLAARLKDGRLHYREAAQLVAVIADALQAAHRKGLVHRDVKPGNILIDREGRAYLADFGLALREDGIGQGPKYVGTLPYSNRSRKKTARALE